ncbi:MAG TPA: cytochrome c biogenesis protein ResB [Dermatophilaceae bacterium]|nr:cytochrome c biogenesis protein ResB [Dermatophilaceae bacterium]
MSAGNSPQREAEIRQPQLGPLGWARWAWRNLTSMRTALFLLLLLSVAAVPGSIFPQRSIDAGRVADYLAANPTIGPWLNRFGFFEVYQSPWFSAVYLLLVISLIGCIIPRTKLHWHALRSRPPRAPRHLERLGTSATARYAGPPDAALAAAREALRRKRFRVFSHDDSSVSGEAGFLRETGNLLFHVAMCVVIVGVAVGHLFGWRGDVIVTEGETFASVFSQYDTFNTGVMVDPNALPPFTIRLDKLDVRFEREAGGAQFGAPRGFTAYTTTVERPGQSAQQHTISVNEPLTLGGADVYLLGNGYSPVVTVRDAAGKVIYQQATPFLAQDNLYKSVGAIKVPSAGPKQLGFSGFFLPTAEPTYVNGPESVFPDLDSPELALSVWEGNLFPGGRPQSVYTLNTAELTPVPRADGKPLAIRLKPGQSYELPGGRGSISFDSVARFAGFSVRTDPGKGLTLAAALATIAGLVASLLVRRRRVFVRVEPDPQAGSGATSTTLVTIGALAKSADPGLSAFVSDLAAQLATSPTPVASATRTERT